MSGLRLALITRRFWPLVGGAESVMANLAGEFQDMGCRVNLLTARWEKHWPAEIVHRDVPVTRLNQPKARGWGTMRYMHAIYHWLRRHGEELDAIFVSMLKHDAHVAIRYGQRFGLPVIVRAEGGGETGDCHWHTVGRFGARIREQTKLADGWVAPSQAIFDEMLAAGYGRATGQFIPNGVRIPPARTITSQGDSRVALAEAHPILHVPPKQPLVLFIGRFHEGKGLADLIDAWPLVLRAFPLARLWLVGEGPFGDRMWSQIRAKELTQSVILPGSFDDLSDVLNAADVMVLPSYQEGMSMSLLEAMAAGLPVAASDIPGNQQLVTDHQTGRLFPIKAPEVLAKVILEVLKQQEQSRVNSDLARQLVEQKFSLRTMAAQHLDVINKAIASRKSQCTTSRDEVGP